jgi:hypothetical protein
MRTRKWIIAAGATLALVVALALPSLTWAQAPGSGPGRGPGNRMNGGPQQSLVAVAAQVLGVSQADLVAQLQSGKTIADVAGDKAGAIVDAFVQPRAERLAALVTAGRLTQAEADQRVATMRAQVTARLSQTWSARGPGAGTSFVDADGDGLCDNAGSGAGQGAGMGRGRMGAGRAGR